jgi:biotin carboxylase
MSSLDLIDRLNDKWRFSQILDLCGIVKPRTILLTLSEDLHSPQIDTVGWPLVLKATNLSGRRGFKKCSSIDEVRDYVGGTSQYSGLPLLAQEYVSGDDIDYGFLAVNGEVQASAVFQRYPGGRTVDFVRDEAVERVGRQIVQATGYTGVGTIDFRKEASSGRRLPLEFNPRFWYSISKAMWCGVNFVELGIALARGKTLFPAVVEPGRWISAGGVVRARIAGRRSKEKVSRGSLKGALDVLSDPLPIAYRLVSKTKGRFRQS